MKQATWLLAASLLVVIGCEDGTGFNRGKKPDKPPLNGSAFMNGAQVNEGIIYILPGIQGADYHYRNMRRGLEGSGIQCAIKIHPWGSQIPGIALAINETDTKDDRAWGQEIANEILTYQKNFPNRPVYLLGQSGGSAICIFAAEALAQAKGQPIEGIVLLDASLGADYDLSTAMSMCRKGIVNFYNLRDVAMLEAGTKIFGNLDGTREDSAGRTGFAGSHSKLFQVKVTREMVEPFAAPHFADTSAAFTSRYISPWIIDQTWPVSTLAANAQARSDSDEKTGEAGPTDQPR